MTHPMQCTCWLYSLLMGLISLDCLLALSRFCACRYTTLKTRFLDDPRVEFGRLHPKAAGPHPIANFEMVGLQCCDGCLPLLLSSVRRGHEDIFCVTGLHPRHVHRGYHLHAIQQVCTAVCLSTQDSETIPSINCICMAL